ncbi:MAG: HAMP domain-containing sensor histidine kinase [Desulfurobacteriaceae bacterium]
MNILFIYSSVSLFSLAFSKRPNIFEFILDGLFIFVLAIKDLISWNFFSIFFLFPIFFSFLLLGRLRGLIVLIVSIVFCLAAYFTLIKEFNSISLTQSFLNVLAFVFIALAGERLKVKFENQEEYIKNLEKERKQNEIYRKLYRISADLAHEIKNPLASIRGAAQLLKEGKQSEKLVEIIYNETVRLDEIVKDFLNLARPISFKEKVSVKDVMEEVVSSLSHFGKKITIDCQNFILETDRKAFYVTIENLLRNAVQWAKSEVRVSCKNLEKALEIVVEDDGVGINEEDEEKIFEPFFSKRKGGSGLGLSIVKRFVMESKGKILVSKSTLGGAKFIVIFPKKVKDESFGSRR